MSNHPQTLNAWLAYLEQQHPREIDLSLDRVRAVAQVMQLQFECPLIIVGGTNGKGSTCALLEQICKAAGYRVGLYTSPHLLKFNERIRVNQADVDDASLCAAFSAIETARGDISLTYFEFATLAAAWIFTRAQLDVAILEVGLGGRLDAVNIFDADCSVITGIAIDHVDYLGDTREKIGFEKAGIMRAGRTAICGDPQPPQSILTHAADIGAQLWVSGRDFGFSGDRNQWQYWGPKQRRSGLAYPALRGANQLLNASSALACLEALSEQLPVSAQAVRQGLAEVELAGRFQVLPGRPSWILDVAHNPQSVAVLAENLASQGFFPVTWALCGMMGDKDVAGSLQHLVKRIDRWLVVDLPPPRGASAAQLAQQLRNLGVAPKAIQEFASPAAAMQELTTNPENGSAENDRIVAFGSFVTVSEVMKWRAQQSFSK